MHIFHTIHELQSHLKSINAVAFVPTMGNLHQGHLSLVLQAQKEGLPTLVSIFINPLQFLPNEDFQSYPRTIKADCQKLQAINCDIVFAPDTDEIYPSYNVENPCQNIFKINPPDLLTNTLEGVFRPGFFVGVCSIMLKLLNIVCPQSLWLGKKDYQQWLVLSAMVTELNLAINVHAANTVREADGLAMSSRNAYLSADERIEATTLSITLKNIAKHIIENKDINSEGIKALEQQAVQLLKNSGWQPDYVAIRNAESLSIAKNAKLPLVVLGAAKLGKTRLIDAIECLT